MRKLEDKELKEALKCVQELKQKLLILKKEYNLSTEAHSLLSAKVEQMRKKILKLNTIGETNSLELAKYVHDCKEWIPAFAEGYELADEAVNALYRHYDQLAHRFEN